MKKIGASIVIALVVVFVILYVRLNQNDSKGDVSQAIAAIPTDASLIVESNNFVELLEDLANKTDFWEKIISFKSFSELKFDYLNIMQIMEESPDLRDVLESNTIVIGLRQQGNYRADMLAVVSLPGKNTQKKFKNSVAQLLKQHNIIPQKYEFNNELMIYSIGTKRGKYYFATYQGNFLITKSKILLETSIRQLGQGESLLDNPDFEQVASAAGENVLANIYINYFTLGDGLIELLSNQGVAKFNKIKKTADWTVLDYKVASNTSRFAGYTYTDESPNKFLAVFSGVEGAKNSIDDILPQETNYYMSLSFNDYYKVYENLSKFASAEGYSRKLKADNKKFNEQYGFEPSIKFLDLIDQNITIASVKINAVKQQKAKYFIVKIKDIEKVKDALSQITYKYNQAHPDKQITPKKEYIVNSSMKTYIYQLPFGYFFNFIFGKSFINIPRHNFYCFTDNYLIMSDSYDNLRFFLDSYYNEETLNKDEDYKNFRANLTAKYNVTIFAKQPLTDKSNQKYFSETLQKDLKNHMQTASSFDKMAIQYSYEDGLFYTYAVVEYNPKAKIESKALWQVALADKATTKPFVFVNHYTFHKEVFVEDAANNIYLIDREGKKLWQRTIDGQIKGNIYMVDYYQNGKYQLLFNTDNYIYLIDRNGKDVENYPIRLPSTATNSISVFDYEKDGNYRIFVACANNEVYLYKKNGKQNKQWHVTKTTGAVKQPVQHFLYKGKDYLVFADNLHTYILNRRGEVRIPVNTTFSKASNTKFYFVPKDSGHAKEFFITTTKSGKLVFIDLDGNVKIYKSPGEYSDDHYFMMSDIDGNGEYEFIFAEKNTIDIYNQNLTKRNTINLPAQISHDLVLYKFGAKDKKLGAVTTGSQQIFLINNDGSVYPTFPKAGNTQFTIKPLIPGYGLNVITGKGKYLVNYQL